nr:unnamed protein product [Digitaria exilis]
MGGGGKAEKARRSSAARVKLWVARATTVLLWTCLVHLAANRELWAPSVLIRWPGGCFTQHHAVHHPSEAVAVADGGQREAAHHLVAPLPPKRSTRSST